MIINLVFQTLAQMQRPLTKGEINLAHSVFGDTIDYSRVKIHLCDRAPFDGFAPDGHIYFRPAWYCADFSGGGPETQRHFIHEMTHVWQAQNGHDPVKGFFNIARKIFAEMPLAEYSRFLPHFYNRYASHYGFSDEDLQGLTFEQLNIEQQARLVDTYFLLREYRQSQTYPPSMEDMTTLRDYECEKLMESKLPAGFNPAAPVME